MRKRGERPCAPTTKAAGGEAWLAYGALFLRLALRGGELLWLTNLPYLRRSGDGKRYGGRSRVARSDAAPGCVSTNSER